MSLKVREDLGDVDGGLLHTSELLYSLAGA